MNRILVTGANGQLGNEMRRLAVFCFRESFCKDHTAFDSGKRAVECRICPGGNADLCRRPGRFDRSRHRNRKIQATSGNLPFFQ